MAAKRYIALVTGRLKQIAAIVVSAGAGNDGDLVALDATGKLDASVMPLGVGVNTRSVVASETLAAGDLVNFWNNAGTLNVRKADATAEGKEVHGFVKAGYSSSGLPRARASTLPRRPVGTLKPRPRRPATWCR
jgi:hypothetical protein